MRPRVSSDGSTPSRARTRRSQIVVSCLVAIAFAGAVYNYQAISSAFAHTEALYNARQLTQQMVGSLFREESSMRGYTSTRDPEYLKPYRQAHVDFERQLDELRDYMWNVGLSGTQPYIVDVARVHGQWSDMVAGPL